MASERERKIRSSDPNSVIGHRDRASPAVDEIDPDVRRTRIKTVFYQFLDDGYRPFDHFAGRYLSDRRLIEHANFSGMHGAGVRVGVSGRPGPKQSHWSGRRKP